MEALVKLLVFVIEFFIKLKEDLADGKISKAEAWGLITKAMAGVWNPIVNFGEIKAAIKLIGENPEAREQLKTLIAEQVDLEDDELEKRIEEGLDLISRIYAYVLSWIPPDED